MQLQLLWNQDLFSTPNQVKGAAIKTFTRLEQSFPLILTNISQGNVPRKFSELQAIFHMNL